MFGQSCLQHCRWSFWPDLGLPYCTMKQNKRSRAASYLLHCRLTVIRIVDISTAGTIKESHLEVSLSEYQNRLDAERQTLRYEGGDLETRLVLFSPKGCINSLICDLYGVEFRIEPSFFAACTPPAASNYRFSSVLEEDPPTFLRLGRGRCAKLVAQNSDHPLVRKGVAISEAANLPSFPRCSLLLNSQS